VAIVKADHKAYLDFMKKNKTAPLDPKNITRGTLSRATADLIIITEALRAGGLDCKLKFLLTPNTQRTNLEVSLGNAVIGAQQVPATSRLFDEPDLFFVSAPITRYGEFQKVFYTTADNPDALAATSVEDLNATGGIIGLHWDSDDRVLRKLGISNLQKCATFESMIKMVIAGRAGWVPLEASANKDLSGIMHGKRFLPVPGLKFALLESRHFLVSRKHPMGIRIHAALQKGLKVLRKRGFIRGMLTAAGLFNKQIESWRLLNKDAVLPGSR